MSRKSCWHLVLFPACIRRGAERPPSNTMLSAESQNPPASSCLVYLLCQMLSGTVLQVELPSLVFPSLKDTNMATINYPGGQQHTFHSALLIWAVYALRFITKAVLLEGRGNVGIQFWPPRLNTRVYLCTVLNTSWNVKHQVNNVFLKVFCYHDDREERFSISISVYVWKSC